MKAEHIINKVRQKLMSSCTLPIAAAAVGLLLLFFGSTQKPAAELQPADSPAQYESLHAYEEALGLKLQQIVGAIAGVGQVKVMLTLESGSEYVFAEQKRSGDGAAGAHQSESSVTVLETDTGDEALVRKQLQPTVKGVAVVCEGGNSISVKQNIVETVSTVLGISSSRVSVAPMS